MMLKDGCPLLWKSGPPPPNTIVQHQRKHDPNLDEWVRAGLQEGIIERVSPSFAKAVSPVFTVPKPDGGFRVIVDLRQVNQYQRVPKFKLEGIKEARHLIKRGCFMTRLDVKDAFFSFFNDRRALPYLCIKIKNQFYTHRSLTMGSSASPYLFNKLTRPIIATLRGDGICVIAYVDDILIISATREACLTHTDKTVTLFKDLGFQINTKKSQLQPVQEIKFLGLIIRTKGDPTLGLSATMRSKIAHELERMTRRTVKAIHVARICGLANFVSTVVLGAKTLSRRLYDLVSSAKSWHSPVYLEEPHKRDAIFLAKLIRSDPRRPLNAQIEDAQLICDASPSGMGAVCQNREGKILMEISKTWKKNEKRHINVLELLTILKALKRLPDTIRVIRVKSDNTTALSYIRLLSGRVIALHNIARQIFKICLRRGLTLIPEYIQGKKNTHADALSRLRQLPVTTQLKRMIGKDHLLFPTPNAIRYALIVPSPKTILTPDWKAHFLRPILMKDCSSWNTIPTAPLQPHKEWPAYIKKSKRLIAFFFEL